MKKQTGLLLAALIVLAQAPANAAPGSDRSVPARRAGEAPLYESPAPSGDLSAPARRDGGAPLYGTSAGEETGAADLRGGGAPLYEIIAGEETGAAAGWGGGVPLYEIIAGEETGAAAGRDGGAPLYGTIAGEETGAAAGRGGDAPLYEIIAGEETGAAALQREMELRFMAYNQLFRFDPALLPAPLKVRVFDDGDAYARYLSGRGVEARPGAVYLHYSQIENRELVIHRQSPDAAAMVAHQAFVQFLRAFVANPPSWMREGFAIFFSALRMTPEGDLDYEENLLWLPTVKNLGEALPSPGAIAAADIAGAPGHFEASSWALVSFLLRSGRDYYRSLTDSFPLLLPGRSPGASAAQNSRAVLDRAALWHDAEIVAADFKAYLESRKTFAELIEDGRAARAEGDRMGAELSFMTAMDQKPSDFTSYYYLGLLAYEEKNYSLAERYYLSSLDRGAEEALINYALGVNAAADGRRTDAENFLRNAARADPARYQARAGELLEKIGQSEGAPE